MEKKIVSLTALFLKNTLGQMKFDSIEKVVLDFEGNILDKLDITFEQINDLLDKKETNKGKKDVTFLRKWRRFRNEKWGYECLKCLESIKQYLEKTQEEPILKGYVEDIQNYYNNEWSSKLESLKFRFSKSYVKEYKDYTQYNELSMPKIDMLTDGLIVPFFEKNKILYDSYLNWIKNIDNFFEIKEKNKIIKFENTQEEYNTIQECVNAYNYFSEFSAMNFYEFLKELIIILETISKSRINQERIDSETLDEIRQDIENFYQELFLYSEDTIGILKEEIDDILCISTNNVIESYLYAKEKRKSTWQECKKNYGFIALMRYRLCFYLSSKRGNEFLEQYIKAITRETKEKYGVYICEEAQIKSKVWIDKNCNIGKCYIDNNVVILSNVEVADGVVLKSGSMIGEGTCIGLRNKFDNKSKIIR